MQESRAKRVLIYEHNIDGTVGGSHYCLLEICRNLDRTRFEPIVCFAQSNSLLDEFRAVGTEVHVHAPSRPIVLGSGPRWLKWILGPLQSLLNGLRTLVFDSLIWHLRLGRLRADIVYLNNSCGGDHEVIMAALLRRKPIVAHQRGFPMGVGPRERWFARRLDAIIAISSSVHADLAVKGIYGEKVILIHDGIDPERVIGSSHLESPRIRFGIPAHAKVVGVVGNVKEWKGQDTLIRAMGDVIRVFPDTWCLVVGALVDEQYANLIRRHISELGLSHRVVFTGYERYPACCMKEMDVVVHTSTSPEPFGLVVLEGMALGKPVIATDHGGPKDVIVHGESGFLTPPHDEHALSKCILDLLSDPARGNLVGTAGRQRLQNLFTAQRNTNAIQDVLATLLKEAAV